jgi:hypothetical protein
MEGAMIVAVCRVELDIPAAESLKDKRQVLQSTITRIRNRFQISVAEVEAQEQWRTAVLGMAVVSNEGGYARDLLERVVRFLDGARMDAEVTSVAYDLLPVF